MQIQKKLKNPLHRRQERKDSLGTEEEEKGHRSNKKKGRNRIGRVGTEEKQEKTFSKVEDYGEKDRKKKRFKMALAKGTLRAKGRGTTVVQRTKSGNSCADSCKTARWL